MGNALLTFFVCNSYVPQVPVLTSDGWAKCRLIVKSVCAEIKDYYQRTQAGIHSRQNSMTISLHRTLLSSLTLNGELQTCY